MTRRAEFRRAAWRHWGLLLARSVAVFALGAFVFAALWLILRTIEPAGSPELRAEIAMAVAFAAGLAAAMLSARAADAPTRRDARLVCPHCDGTLGYLYIALVLTSGNCPHCGEPVFED